MGDEIGTFNYDEESDIEEISELINHLREGDYIVDQRNDKGKFEVKVNRNRSFDDFEEGKEDDDDEN